jgi:2-polyprenyl-3-methyl-5-hydroxy-6-metoxy-1,4-benzoquinol methylase
MDLEKFYDEYWTNKGDDVDYNRLNMIVKHIESGKKVLEINGGIGLLAEKMAKKGADVTLTDLSGVALQRAKSRGIQKVFKVDLDTQTLPFDSAQFDIVVSNSMIEHSFFPENTIREGVRVLKDKGIFIIMVPNIGHWRFRLWLLLGRFPYLQNTPTDNLHLRFFTCQSIKKMGKQFGLKVKKVRGYSGLWVKSIYPTLFQLPIIKQIYELLTLIYPSLFARYILIIFEK